MHLADTEVVIQEGNPKQIFIVCFNGENNLLMEAGSADDADDWVIAIRDHTKFANSAYKLADFTVSGCPNKLKDLL